MSSKEEIIHLQGWKLRHIKNPDYPNKSLDEYIQVAEYWKEEFIEVWYWLIYQGKDKEGYAPPLEKLIDWRPEFNCWRDATNEEMKEIMKYIKSGNYHRLKENYTFVKTYRNTSKKLGGDIKIPISFIDRLPNGWIVKKWRSNEELE